MAHALVKLRADDIRAHILDPENHPLPRECQEQFDMVCTIGQMLDEYPQDSQIMEMCRRKYNKSDSCMRVNIKLARELFKSKFDFDYDFWKAWEIRDQLQLIAQCKKEKDLKAWNDAKKVLHKLIGDKPEALADPKRMEKNVINIQINKNGHTTETVGIDKIRTMKEEEREKFFDSIDDAIEVADAIDIMNS